MENKKGMRCSFCNRPSDSVYKLIAGPGVGICDQCIMLCYEMIEQKEPQKKQTPKPYDIHAFLDQYVVGQEKAKKVLSVAVYNHYKRIASGTKGSDIDKSNILLLGPTGAGKTLLVRTLAKFLNVPLAVTDATSLTEAGYVGEDVENILLSLVQAADYDIDQAEKGIIYIDEFDKIARKDDSPSLTRDVSGEGVQQALLKIFEGTTANVPPHGGRKHPHQEFLQLNTRNILFICGGSFSGIETIIRQRLGKSAIGFNQQPVRDQAENMLHKLIPRDLIRYGLIPECVGRLPVTVALDELTREDLVRILTEPVDSLVKQYQKIMELDGVGLEFHEDALAAVADQAISLGTGARGLKSVLEDVLLNVMYEVPSKQGIEKCIITRNSVEKKDAPTFVYSTGRTAKAAC